MSVDNIGGTTFTSSHEHYVGIGGGVNSAVLHPEGGRRAGDSRATDGRQFDGLPGKRNGGNGRRNRRRKLVTAAR